MIAVLRIGRTSLIRIWAATHFQVKKGDVDGKKRGRESPSNIGAAYIGSFLRDHQAVSLYAD
jgi:hypothetical protein